MAEAALENQYADELRRQRMGGSEVGKEAKFPSGSLASGAEGESSSLRERVMAARRALDVKERAKQALRKKVMAPAKQATSQLLKSAWRIMCSIVGFLPGLLYVNIHVFLKMVLGENFFCKLGEEWIPKQAAAVGGEAAKTAGKGIGIIEVMVLLFLDILVAVIILSALSFFVMIVSFMGAGFWEKIKYIWDAIGTLGWGAVQAIIDLFS